MNPGKRESNHGGMQDMTGFWGPMVMLGTQMAVGMVLFVVIGRFLDGRTGGGIGWTLGGMFMGLFYGAYETWKTVRLINRRCLEEQANRIDRRRQS